MASLGGMALARSARAGLPLAAGLPARRGAARPLAAVRCVGAAQEVTPKEAPKESKVRAGPPPWRCAHP